MSTKHTPLRVLMQQAGEIARKMKAIEAGQPVHDPGGKIAASKKNGIFRPAIVMDDKTVIIEISWETVKVADEKDLAAYILGLIREERRAH